MLKRWKDELYIPKRRENENIKNNKEWYYKNDRQTIIRQFDQSQCWEEKVHKSTKSEKENP